MLRGPCLMVEDGPLRCLLLSGHRLAGSVQADLQRGREASAQSQALAGHAGLVEDGVELLLERRALTIYLGVLGVLPCGIGGGAEGACACCSCSRADSADRRPSPGFSGGCPLEASREPPRSDMARSRLHDRRSRARTRCG